MSDFEAQLLFHASPALLGEKQANLFAFPLSRFKDCQKEIRAYRKSLAPLGISVEYLYCSHNRVYLYIYRKELLLAFLNRPAVKAFLVRCGYPADIGTEASLQSCLCYLRKRVVEGGDFPHEIGFFLGYPEEDVFSFIREKGQNYKFVGCWKVYGDENAARTTFRRYRDCRDKLIQQAEAGVPILKLLEGTQPTAL